MDWKVIYEFFETGSTFGYDFEKTNETDIYINLNDGTGKSKIKLELQSY
jgi:hypothetical protein